MVLSSGTLLIHVRVIFSYTDVNLRDFHYPALLRSILFFTQVYLNSWVLFVYSTKLECEAVDVLGTIVL